MSSFEFHVNPVICLHSGQAFIQGTVYLNKNDPSSRYSGALVVLGSTDGAQRWEGPQYTKWDGSYTFILNSTGPKPGYYGVWLVSPSLVRKSDVGGPIAMNDLPETDPRSCWAATVDFWK